MWSDKSLVVSRQKTQPEKIQFEIDSNANEKAASFGSSVISCAIWVLTKRLDDR
jgi:hypothetical protein